MVLLPEMPADTLVAECTYASFRRDLVESLLDDDDEWEHFCQLPPAKAGGLKRQSVD